jgi:hypothetical protein
MHHHGYTIGYFLWKGIVSGLLCGLLFGTLVFPVGGQLAGAPIGGLAGGVIGLLLGIAIAIYNRLYFNFDTDMTQYRRVIARDAGIGAGVLMFIGLTSPFLFNTDFQWDNWYRIREILLWICVIALPSSLMASLASAFVTHQYANQYAQRMTKQKRDVKTDIESAPHLVNRDVHRFFTERLIRNGRWFIGLASTAIGLIAAMPYLGSGIYFLEFAVLAGGIAAGIMTGSAFIIAIFNGALIVALNRIYLDEYFLNLPLPAYKSWIGWMSGTATLIYCVIVTGGIFAPVAAFFAAWTARQYADYRYETPEKAKNKAKHDAVDRLQLPDTKFDGLLSDDVPAVESVRQQK